MRVTTKERGWPGHFICADRCVFTRNTLVSNGDIMIVVSTVGNLVINGKLETVGHDRYYETMVFHAKKDCKYNDIDVGKIVDFKSNWCLPKSGMDNKANDMHDNVVSEIVKRMKSGDKFKSGEE